MSHLTNDDIIQLGVAHAYYFDLTLCPTKGQMVYTKHNYYVWKLSDDRCKVHRSRHHSCSRSARGHKGHTDKWSTRFEGIQVAHL